MKELIELLEAKINRLGELHLGKEHVDLLMKYLRTCDKTIQQQDECITEIKNLITIERKQFADLDAHKS